MKIAPLAKVKDRFSAYIVESQESPVVVTRNGHPAAMIIGITNEDDLDNLRLAHNPRFVQLLEEARQRVRTDSSVPFDEFRSHVQDPESGVR